MDKGAHYYRCDFQVHSPRDLGWDGQGAVTADERKKYAEELILDCRRRGIDAIAITDHHDFTFFPYIKKASQSELDDQGNSLLAERRIIVFPGIELTLTAPTCQALVIFDADFPENLLHSILVALAITPNPPENAKTAQVVRIPQNVINDLTHLYQILNQHEHLRNRFIVLPHVKENGHGTLLRSGFANFYRSMPCVGGYTDGLLPSLGTGAHDIIHGKNRDYGFKALGVFQTSDNRKRNHDDLGRFSTWVKWALPSAEALRQACLAKESRISQSVPLLPAIHVISIDVSSSKFMGQIYLEFNPQYNALIGGRGTGKSTILEYLRWGLCDQIPANMNDDEGIPGYQEKRKKLIEKTLLPFDSTVQISFVKNGIPHIIRRKSGSAEIYLKIGAGEFEICAEDDVRNILPVQAYSQKQLSSVGVSLDELKRLIYSPVRQTLNEFDDKFQKLRSEIRNCYELKQRKRLLENEIERNELESKSLTVQVEELRKGLKGLTEDDKTTISMHKQYEMAEQAIEEWMLEISSIGSAIQALKEEVSNHPATVPDDVEFPDSEKTVIADIQKHVKDLFEKLGSDIDSLGRSVADSSSFVTKINGLVVQWQKKLKLHKEKYEKAKQKSTSQEATLIQIQKTEDRLKDIRKAVSEKKQGVIKTGDPEARFDALKEQWFGIHKDRADVLDVQCARLSELSDGNLRATLGRGRETSDMEDVLKKIISGSNIRRDKVDELCSRIKDAQNPVEEWVNILSELEQVSLFDPIKAPTATLPSTLILNTVGFSVSDVRKISEKLTPENWIDLLLVQLGDRPIFQYRSREGEYIEFADASAGQQATALMYVLLNQEGPPLIIDQPEDDLDNQMVSNIAALIWKAKKKRQIIFTSHNANIVVNGDAELVACCSYKITGDQSKGEIHKLGAIDVEDIRNEITLIMEGGEEAFKLRKDKYGF